MTEDVGHFSLWGDFEVDEITIALKLQPSDVFRKGDVLDGAEFPAKVATWDFYCPANLTLNEQIKFLLDLLLPRAEALRRFASRFKAEFNLVVTLGEVAQVLTLSPEELESLASLHVTLNCFYLEDEAEDGN